MADGVHATKVVILNYNGAEILPRFLPSVVKNTPPEAEIVVADNGSTDGSVELLKRDFPSVRLVTLDRNYGFAEGYNRALAQVEADCFVLLNSDVEVTEGWLDPLETLLESDPNAAAVMPKIRSWHERDRFEYAGAAGGFIDRLGYPFCRGRVLQAVERDEGQYDDRRPIFWATGACIAVRSTCYAAAGGLPASFFAHQEEIDLCWRLQSAGWTIWVEPASVVYHVGGGTMSADNPRKTYLNFRNNLTMLYRNLPGGTMRRIMALRLILDGLSAWVFLLQGKPKLFRAVWRAHRDFFRGRKSELPIRRALQQGRPALPSQIYRGSIVWRYFTGRRISPVK